MTRILVIDDEPLVRSTVRKMLERGGYDVVEADSGRGGLQMVEAQTVDLVLTDIIMPDMEGLETLRRLGRAAPTLPVIAMSGGGRLSAMKPLAIAKAFGAREALKKPFSGSELLHAVESTLGAVGQ